MAGVGRRVVDKTGLTEPYDFTLYFRPLDGPESDAPDIEQAIQEQLGLKLVSSELPDVAWPVHVQRTGAVRPRVVTIPKIRCAGI